MNESGDDFEFLGFRGRECEEAVFRVGQRKTVILLNEPGQFCIEFHHMRKWAYPDDADPFTEQDRQQLIRWLADFCTSKGYGFHVDYRRRCSRCNEILPGSDSPTWTGANCHFCGATLDPFGQRIQSD